MHFWRKLNRLLIDIAYNNSFSGNKFIRQKQSIKSGAAFLVGQSFSDIDFMALFFVCNSQIA